MSDTNERIVVEVDGTQATEGFGRIRTAAEQADSAINSLGNTVNQTQNNLNGLGTGGNRAATGLNQAGNAAQTATTGIQGAGQAATTATNHFNALQQSLFGVRGKAAFIWDLAADGFRMAMGFADSFIDRASAIQRTFSLLATIPGNNADEQFSYLTRTANNYGLSLRAIQDDYAKLNLAAENTSLTSEGVRRVFEQVSLATRTLHLNTQQTQLTFLAVEQMLSKGKVSMEELRKQFAERVPGAMQALARELGVTYPVLERFITKMGAASDKIVPELGNAIQRLYQDALPNAVRALDAERNRLETSVTMFFKNVVSAGGTEGMAELLKSINSLLQTETVAEIFADAVNKITRNLAMFLATLKPDDIERFAKTALDFLSAFTQLALAAGRAVIFLSQNIPAVGAAIGAFVGATALAPLGPWGAAIGLIGGGAAGFLGAKSIAGSSQGMGDLDQMTARYNQLDVEVRALEMKVQDKPKGWFGMQFDSSGGRDAVDLKKLTEKRDALRAQLEPMWAAQNNNLNPSGFDNPVLGDRRDMSGKTAEEQLAFLMKNFGLDGTKKKSKDEVAAEKLYTRQQNALQDVEARLRAFREPETDAFATLETNLKQMGIKSGHPDYVRMQNMLVELQYYKNERDQKKSDVKTQGTEKQFENMQEGAFADIGKFREKYDQSNLQQIDDSDWATKARNMGSQLDAVLIEQQKKWENMARDNPLFNFGFDREAKLKELRAIGDAYIEEFKRIESEKRTVMGGSKSFLKEWNDDATNYGQITKDFLSGVSGGITDMLSDLVLKGKFSFAALTQFVLQYIAKMMIVQAITPFMNMFAGAITGGMSSLLNLGSTAGSSLYSLSSGSGGLGLQMRAAGGPVWPGEPFLVGERGPEVVTFDRPGYVHPNESLKNTGGGNVTIQVNIDAKGQTSTSGGDGMAQMGRRIGDAVRSIIVEEKRPGGMLA